MQFTKLLALTPDACWQAYLSGKMTRFECQMRDYATQEIRWPEYKGPDVAALRKRLRISQGALAALLHVSQKTVAHWESGAEIPCSVQIVLGQLDHLEEGIFSIAEGSSSFLAHVAEATGQTKDLLTAAKTLANIEDARRKGDVPSVFTAEDVAALRARLHLTRPQFAKKLGVSSSTADKWEDGSIAPRGAGLMMLKIVWKHGLEILPSHES